MSDQYTSVEVQLDGKAVGMGLWGWVDPDDAIKRTREMYERDLAEVKRALFALDRNKVKVFHQYGPWAAYKRKQVYGDE
jgi:hypothetical protein